MKSIKLLVLAFFLGILIPPTFGQSTNDIVIKVNEQRIESRILELSKFGKDQYGKGQRIAFSEGDIKARNWFINLMKKAGLEVKIDEVGNIIGRRNGKDSQLKPIAFGSHIDMVPDGGNYDGCVGSVSALEIIEILNFNNITTTHPLEVIIFADEETGFTGCLGMSGKLTSEDLKTISTSGLLVSEGIKAIGGNPDKYLEAVRKKGDLKAFLELHIEQGGVLEKENIEIGVVDGIVGVADWDITFQGMANHAGTTPMNLRKDALLAASKFIVAVHEVINSYEGAHVGNVGKITALPGAYNVIPGVVILGLQLRDLSDEKIAAMFKDIEKHAAEIEKESGVTIDFQQPTTPGMAALTDRNLRDIISESATKLGFSSKTMPSGAGHDSQEIATIAPIGMIFVPSVAGISHSPLEFTNATDMANGANVLLQTILALDKEIE